jgi:site-specific DNA recombinase
MTCDKCSTRMVGNSTSSKAKGGRRRYYVCGRYLRKGKEYCSYAGWNKERAEELVANRLRITFMKLLMNDTLEQEMQLFYYERNQHKLTLKKNLENEIEFLNRRIELVEVDIQSGKAKPYHQEMLADMQKELQSNTGELIQLTSGWEDFSVPEEEIAAIKYDLQAFLGLLDQEVPNVQLLQSIASKYISRLFIDRDTKKLYMTLQFNHNEKVVYEKTIVCEW